MLKSLSRDPFVRIALILWAIVTLCYLVPIVPREWLDAYSASYVDVPLLPWAVLACWIGLREVGDRRERQFWMFWGASLLSSLAVTVAYAMFPDAHDTVAFNVFADVLYLLFYLFQLLALEVRPHVQHTGSFSDRERQLRSMGLVVAAFFALVYFVIVPAEFSRSAYATGVPSYYLFLALDAIVLVRLIWLRRETWSVRWAAIYTWLAAAMALVSAGDAIEMSYVLRGQDVPPGTMLDVIWTIPFVLFVLATRSRHVPFPAEQRILNEPPAPSQPLRAGQVLMIAAFGLPLAHYVCTAAHLFAGTTTPLREVIAMANMIVLGALAFVAYHYLEYERAEIQAAQLRLAKDLGLSRKMDAVARLAAAVAHDFNNLLTVIRGRVDIIAADMAEGDPLRDQLREIRVAASRATDLASELMAFGRTQPAAVTTVSLHDTLDRCRQLLKPVFSEKIALRLNLTASADTVRIDPLQFERVILNLGTNARDAMPQGGTLTIHTANPPLGRFEGHTFVDRTQVRLAVADTGEGMAADVTDHIFEPFFTTKRDRGSGLGLAIVHGLVQQFGGTIGVASTPGAGTTFTISLPVADGTAPPSAETPRGSRAPAAILIVDDDPANRQMLRRLFVNLDRPVLTTETGHDAEQVSNSYGGPVAVVIVDVTTDGGASIVSTLRHLHPGLRALYLAQDQAIETDSRDVILREPFELSDVLAATHALLRAV